MAELTMTVQDFVDAGACYEHEQIEELFAGREALSALDILDLDIPDNDKLWAVLREMLIPERTLHLLAVEFARAALLKEREAGREPDERCWRALDVRLAWLDGKASDEELRAAWDATQSVFYSRFNGDTPSWHAANAASWTARPQPWTATYIAYRSSSNAGYAGVAQSELIDIVRRLLRGGE